MGHVSLALCSLNLLKIVGNVYQYFVDPEGLYFLKGNALIVSIILKNQLMDRVAYQSSVVIDLNSCHLGNVRSANHTLFHLVLKEIV